MTEFKAFPKIPRLFRDMTITEKIDGTNGAIHVEELAPSDPATPAYRVTAQSRNRLITPESDNMGFARWVQDNATDLARHLGPGTHYGEWWGSGIQRGYGMTGGTKFFSLFNTHRFKDIYYLSDGLLRTVPVLFQGPFSTPRISWVMDLLKDHGSFASSSEGVEFSRPEGIIVYHSAGQQMFKATFEHDEGKWNY